MTLPTIHLNGTSRDGLVSPLVAASDAIAVAFDALKQTYPNGRDYYPQGPDAIRRATEEYMARLHRLDSVKAEIDSIIKAISG